jgi:hypothetical protein
MSFVKDTECRVEPEVIVAFKILADELVRHVGFAEGVRATKAKNFVRGWAVECAWRCILGDVAKRRYQYRGIFMEPPEVEVTIPSLEILLQRHGFRQGDGKRYLGGATSSPSGSGRRWTRRTRTKTWCAAVSP